MSLVSRQERFESYLLPPPSDIGGQQLTRALLNLPRSFLFARVKLCQLNFQCGRQLASPMATPGASLSRSDDNTASGPVFKINSESDFKENFWK